MAKWQIIAIDETTSQIKRFGDVEAETDLGAFAVAAKRNADLAFVAAIPASANISFPGESMVYGETILEQDDVFCD